MRTILIMALACMAFGCKEVNKKSVVEETTTSKPNTNETPQIASNSNETSVYDFKLTNIDGKPFTLREYAGKKILIVNTASQCGYTKQYAALEELYNKYKEKLVVVGFPANNFGGQEPGSNGEIKEFCKKNFGVSFPLSEKVDVVGGDAAPLFKYLLDKEKNGGINAAIKWNFTKFLIDEKGKLVANYPSSVAPMDDAIISRL